MTDVASLASIKDQVAMVAGGAAGIGRACAERFASEGASVAVVARDRATGEDVVAAIKGDGGEAMFVAADCTSEADMDAAVTATVEAYGRLDILANCAGGFHDTPTIEEHDLSLIHI